MAQLTVDWTGLTAQDTHDPDRDRPHLWVFGILVDAATIGSGRYVLRRRPPSGIDLDTPVTPVSGLVAAGVVVVAWPPARTGDPTALFAYDAAADALDALVGERVAAADLVGLGAGAMRDLRLRVEQDVTDSLRDGWTAFALVPDRPLGSAQCLLTLDGPVDQALELRLTARSGHHRLRGTLRYSVGARQRVVRALTRRCWPVARGDGPARPGGCCGLR